MTEQNEKLLLNVTEVAELTGFAIGSLYRWISEGRLPVIRISARCVRFRRSDIEAWIEQKAVLQRDAEDRAMPTERAAHVRDARGARNNRVEKEAVR
jgi:excisionase family DNA binding protein